MCVVVVFIYYPLSLVVKQVQERRVWVGYLLTPRARTHTRAAEPSRAGPGRLGFRVLSRSRAFFLLQISLLIDLIPHDARYGWELKPCINAVGRLTSCVNGLIRSERWWINVGL